MPYGWCSCRYFCCKARVSFSSFLYRSKDLLPTQCFYISKDYYTNAVDYFRHVQAKNKTLEEAREFERLKSPNSDICSDSSSHYRNVDTGQSSECSSVTKDNISEKAAKSIFISKNMVYNPVVYEFRRKHKSRHTITYQQHPLFWVWQQCELHWLCNKNNCFRLWDNISYSESNSNNLT